MIVEIILSLCDNQGTSIPKLEKKLGFSNGSIYKWRKSSPSVEKIGKIADYFNVSIDYIMGNTPFKSKIEEKHSIAVAVMKHIRGNGEIPKYFNISVAEELYKDPKLKEQYIYSESLLIKYDKPNIQLTDLEYFEIFNFAISEMKYDSDFKGSIFLTDNYAESISIDIPFRELPKITLDTTCSQLFKLNSNETNFTKFSGELSYTNLTDSQDKHIIREETLPYGLEDLGIEYIELTKDLKDSDLDIDEIKQAVELARKLKKKLESTPK